MKIYLYKCNWSDVFELAEERSLRTDIEIEITPELWEEHERLIEQFMNIQERLRVIYDNETSSES
jgi:hypothetical protein